MAWVRIHDGAMGNLKILRLSDSAFRLWVQGLCYCQTHLTDGLIPREALRQLGAKRRDVDMLSSVLVDGKAPLWESIEAFGFKVHDYLTWNDCREKVVERQTDAKRRRDEYEARKKAARLAASPERIPNASVNASKDASITKPNLTKEKKELSPAKEPPDPSVRAFLTWFIEEYKTRRHGAEYLVKWGKHTTLVKPMLKAVSLERLQNFARILLSDKTDDEFIVKSDRGIEVLSVKFNWISERLAQFEARSKVGAA